jgi:N utilization substance protein B
MTRDPIEQVISFNLTGLDDNKDAHAFARKLVVETIGHSAEIDKIIKHKVANWDFKRIALLDRLILRMAICELIFFKEIPPKVSMNEAIELAKLFSTEKSGQFVNGILDAVFDDLKGSGELAKAGRGLWGGEEPQRSVAPRKSKSG